MKPDVVADVGNSRIKWGYCQGDKVAGFASLEPENPEVWQRQFSSWNLSGRTKWVVGGVQPQRLDSLVSWLRERNAEVVIVDSWQQLPLAIAVPHKERVGIDRLFNAVAAKSRLRHDTDTLMIGAGTAVTVDWMDTTGAFRGGAIFPGLRLMAQALHDYTARLPVVEPPHSEVAFPGTTTVTAIQSGIFWAIAGGIQAFIRQIASRASAHPEVFLTGGDAPLFAPALDSGVHMWREMTLEGIRLTAETLP